MSCSNAMARFRTAVAASGFGMKAPWSRFIVFTKLSAMPLLCGLHTDGVSGFSCYASHDLMFACIAPAEIP